MFCKMSGGTAISVAVCGTPGMQYEADLGCAPLAVGTQGKA
ncbi:hypothetical protein M2432_003373 [Mycobacterium sp. OTB74]|jgi:hypothetical protein|nr:hypothetical protein [Mycobacterium sp. OTB74]